MHKKTEARLIDRACELLRQSIIDGREICYDILYAKAVAEYQRERQSKGRKIKLF
jgi:hypothetical protein